MQIMRLFLPMVLVLVALLAAGQAQEKKPLVYDTPFYPLRPGSQWRYKVTSGETQPQKTTITVDLQEKYDYKYTEDKKEINETILRTRLKIASGTKELLEHVAVLKDGVYRFTTAGKEIAPPLRFLKLPLNKGESWTVDSLSENMQLKGTFVCEDDSVLVPFGQFQTKKVSCAEFHIGPQKMAIDYWFAPNVGIVKQRVKVANTEVLLELEDFKPGK